MYRFKARSPRPLAQKAGVEPTLTESKSVAFPFGYFCVCPLPNCTELHQATCCSQTAYGVSDMEGRHIHEKEK